MKCEFCEKDVEFGTLRCKECDIVWETGMKFGKRMVKSKLKNILYELNELSSDNPEDLE